MLDAYHNDKMNNSFFSKGKSLFDDNAELFLHSIFHILNDNDLQDVKKIIKKEIRIYKFKKMIKKEVKNQLNIVLEAEIRRVVNRMIEETHQTQFNYI